jgi:hypothetical protein
MSSLVETLRRRYESLSDDELRFIASEDGLTEEAKVTLERELNRRGIRDVRAYKEMLDRDEVLRREELERKLEHKDKANRSRSRIGVAIVLLLFLAGAYRLFVEGNDIDGPGIMIASVFVLALLLVRHYVYRFIWRLLLRP